jgi:hypothetical protein
MNTRILIQKIISDHTSRLQGGNVSHTSPIRVTEIYFLLHSWIVYITVRSLLFINYKKSPILCLSEFTSIYTQSTSRSDTNNFVDRHDFYPLITTSREILFLSKFCILLRPTARYTSHQYIVFSGFYCNTISNEFVGHNCLKLTKLLKKCQRNL